ncbi:MAG: acyl-homoserine-lactone synthase [Pseudomonadota bacterium]
MIEIVTPGNRRCYAPLIEDMYRMRYDVVVKKWGWRVPGATPGRDKDQFDTDETVYILHLDEGRRKVLGCCRLNPTTGPTMLSDLFEDACDLQAVPRDRTIWEASRFVVSRDWPRASSTMM